MLRFNPDFLPTIPLRETILYMASSRKHAPLMVHSEVCNWIRKNRKLYFQVKVSYSYNDKPSFGTLKVNWVLPSFVFSELIFCGTICFAPLINSTGSFYQILRGLIKNQGWSQYSIRPYLFLLLFNLEKWQSVFALQLNVTAPCFNPSRQIQYPLAC